MSEKTFRGDKTYPGDKSFRVHSTESVSAKIFIEFIAIIIRNRIYTCLVDEMNKLNKKPYYMTVVAAIKELEKIEMTRQADNVYRLDHAVTATQEVIKTKKITTQVPIIGKWYYLKNQFHSIL